MSDQPSQSEVEIGRVLTNSWDPLGVGQLLPSDPRRRAYVGPVLALLAARASDRQIAEHLCAVETAALGYQDSDPGMLRPTAKKVRNLYRRLAAEDHAV